MKFTNAKLINAIHEGILWFFLIFFILFSHILGIAKPGGRDDLSVLRASSYLSRLPQDSLVLYLKNDLTNNREHLDSRTYNRFNLRFDLIENYIATNFLIGLLENLPVFFAFQSVVILIFPLHILGASILFLTLGWHFGNQGRILKLSLLLSIAPQTLKSFEVFIFSFREDLWLNILPRGPLFFLFISSIIIWNNPPKIGYSSMMKAVLVIALFLLSFALHRSMAIYYYLVASLITMFYIVANTSPVKLASTKGIRIVLIYFNLLWLIVSVAKLHLFKLLDADRTSVNWVGLTWIISINLIFYLWFHVSKRQENKLGSLVRAGDIFINYLLPFSILSLGLQMIFVFDNELRLGNFFAFIIMEAGVRLAGVVHLLWWFNLGIILFLYLNNPSQNTPIREKLAITGLIILPFFYQREIADVLLPATIPVFIIIYHRISKRNRWLMLRAGITFLLVIMAIGTYNFTRLHINDDGSQIPRIFDCELLTTQASSLLDEFGVRAYQDEVKYYQGISNELREKYLPDAKINKSLSCSIIPSIFHLPIQ